MENPEDLTQELDQQRRFAQERAAMVQTQVVARGIQDSRVIKAMEKIPRHLFVPEPHQDEAYEDHPVSIGLQQTISQPYIVAFMAEALGLRGTEKILEVGSGSGYMTAILSQLAKEVHGIELEPFLTYKSVNLLQRTGIANAHIHCGDGSMGYPKEAPFDAILVSCAATKIPTLLLEQLSPKGKLLLPLQQYPFGQNLVRITLQNGIWEQEPLMKVVFVPMRKKSLGEAPPFMG